MANNPTAMNKDHEQEVEDAFVKRPRYVEAIFAELRRINEITPSLPKLETEIILTKARRQNLRARQVLPKVDFYGGMRQFRSLSLLRPGSIVLGTLTP